MEEYPVKILSTTPVTHNVIRFKVEKPEGYTFIPGQATEVSINTPEWKEERRPFTFTSLNKWPELEFTIKIYDDHDGVTHQLGQLGAGDELLLHDVWGAIEYKGPGVFLAGGAGLTPFIAIFRDLHEKGRLDGCSLHFSNKTEGDIIIREELERYLGPRFHNVITGTEAPGKDGNYINADYIRENITDFDQHFYVCGPDQFVEDVNRLLEEAGARPDALVFEK